MATLLENLTAAREGYAAKLAATATGDYSSAEEFKPNFNGANGLDRVGYVRMLMEMISAIDAEITKHDVFEITSEMST